MIAFASLLAATFALPVPGRACTTGVVSGKATVDGRPILWKNRDTAKRDNQVVLLQGAKFRYLGVVDAGSRGSIWMGVNEAGFCIENSVVRDLPGGNKSGPGNGPFMKRALATCATVEEFEELLESTNDNGRTTKSNFGVIDAQGGAAIFEASHQAYKKFDANDPETAPHGYVVRSNFSMTGPSGRSLENGKTPADIYSGDRYLRADALFAEAARDETSDFRYVVRNCCRDMADGDGEPYCRTVNGSADGLLPDAINTAGTICRRSTVSAAVFHGVKPGENPLLTTMWVMLGDPAFSAAVPCWVGAEAVAEPLLGGRRSSLCTLAIELRDANYADKDNVETGRLTEIWERLWPVEDELFDETAEVLERWRRRMPAPEEMRRHHESAAARVHDALSEVRGGVLEPAAAAGR
ncbi:MAG: peptidase C45 [Planctomycetaceae bacterium]